MTKFILRDIDPKDERPIELWLERDEDESIKLMASHSSRNPEPHYIVVVFPEGDIHISPIYSHSGVTWELK